MRRAWNTRSFKSFLRPGEEIVYDSHPIAKPWKWMPWSLVLITGIAILLAFMVAHDGRAALVPYILAMTAVVWPLYFNSRNRAMLTERALLYQAGGLAKVRQMPLEDITSIAMHGLFSGRSFLVYMTGGKQLKLSELPGPKAFWQALPDDLKAPDWALSAKRWQQLSWTVYVFRIPLLLLFMLVVFVALNLYGELSPYENRFLGATFFFLIAIPGVIAAFAGSHYVATWIALWLWRKAIPIAEAKACFIWDLDPGHGSLSSRLNSALLPLGAWILRRVYGQPVDFDLGR